LHVLPSVTSGIQIGFRCCLRLFNKTMQQNHAALGDAKDHAGDSVADERAANLPKPAAEGPTELDQTDIIAQDLAVSDGDPLQPITHRPRARHRSKV